MPEDFITLSCQSCGGKLEVFEDMERFACAYCGTEMMVLRRGGTVALKMVEAAIQKVQVGTDKTAAELAISRYQSEASELRKNLALDEERNSPGCGYGCAALFVIFGAWLGSLGSSEFGLKILGVGILLGVFMVLYEKHRQKRNLPLLLRLEELNRLIAEKQRIAES